MKNLISSFIIRYIFVFIVSFNFLFSSVHHAQAQDEQLYRIPASSAEHIAFSYFHIAQTAPNISELAVYNLSANADPNAGQKEIIRLQKLLGETRPESQYIIIQDFVDFTAKQGPTGERLFVFPAFSADFFQKTTYQQLNFMVIPAAIETFHEIDLTADQVSQFMHSFDQEPFIGYTLHIRAKQASKDEISLEDDVKYNMLTGEIAYIAFLDRTGNPFWYYKAPWYGQTLKTSLDTLYYKDGAATSLEMESVNSEIKTLYKK
jgi:hypothetical protein|tara:strand:+ start:148 stop:933 length:786 start_codon:yes stop_codon:yes gene_type:complete